MWNYVCQLKQLDVRCTESVSNLHCTGSHTHTVSEYVCMRFVINLSLCQSSLTLIWISKFSSALCSLYLLWITTTTESTHFYTWTLGSERRTVNVFRNVCNCVIEFRIQWYTVYIVQKWKGKNNLFRIDIQSCYIHGFIQHTKGDLKVTQRIFFTFHHWDKWYLVVDTDWPLISSHSCTLDCHAVCCKLSATSGKCPSYN